MSPARSAALWCALIVSLGISLDTVELLAERRQLAEGGLFGYSVLMTGRRLLLRWPTAPVLGAIFRYPNVLVLSAVQLVGAATMFIAAIVHAPAVAAPAGIAAAVVLGARMLLYSRNQLGMDGSDQMMLVVCTGIAFCLLVPSHLADIIGVDYIAAQLLLSYAISGGAKAISPQWRSGRAISGVMNTIGYGVPALGTFLRRRPQLSRVLCWSVIAFECGSPFLVLFGTPGAEVIIAIGLSFHIAVAFLMGLNVFPWSFGATYPALLLLAHSINGVWR
jgi:hypothetical protein